MSIDKATVKAAIAAEVIIPDGHTLFAPEFYEKFFPVREWNLVQVHESDGTGKGSIFDHDGNVIQRLEAVYNLTFLRSLARRCGIEYSPYSMGRGSEAREWVTQLTNWANS